jgi:hypothetical protein
MVVLSGIVAPAQEQTGTITSSVITSGVRPSQAAALSTLPEADTLIYVSPQRILSDAAPKFVPDADLVKMRQQFADIKKGTGVDPSQVEYVALALRFRKPGADLNFQPPEFLIVASGDLSADSLITMAQLMMSEKWKVEMHGSKSLTLITIDDFARQAETNPMLKSFTQLGLVALSSNTIAAGSVSYLKAAVDAAEGQNRISPETLNSLLRDPSALVSIAGSPLTSFAKSFGLWGTDANSRAPLCQSKFGDFYAAITMEGTSFKLRGILNADNPDTAKVIDNLVSGLMETATNVSKGDQAAQMALKMLTITPQDNELKIEADVPQQMVVDFIREQLKPKPAAEEKKAAPKPTKRRTRRR